MSTLKSFQYTDVCFSKSQGEIMKLLTAHGIQEIGWRMLQQTPEEQGSIGVYFSLLSGSRRLNYRMSVQYRSKPGPRGGVQGTTIDQAARALYWHLKAKFDAIDWGITSMEEEFLPYMLTVTGATVFEENVNRLTQICMHELLPVISGREKELTYAGASEGISRIG